ncbi:MAG: hypothetical protein PHP62_05495 [Candidatus Moranbacteria bacterium]|nr:hypothetical protein [Candidatus Moranbacteria bacterium]
MKVLETMFLVLVLLLVTAMPILAESSDNDDVAITIKREVVHAMVDYRAVNFSKISLDDVQKYFQDIFSSEKKKVSWVQGVIRGAGSYRNINANVYINEKGMTLALEDFIEIDLGEVTYVFFKSGRTAFSSISKMQFENYPLE